MNRHLLTLALALAIFALGTSSSLAYSMGTTYTVDNPANLTDGKWFGLTLTGDIFAGSSAWNPGLLYEMHNKDLTDADKERILDSISSDAITLGTDTRPHFQIKLGPVGLRAAAVVDGYGSIDKELIELALLGNELGRTYELDGTAGGGAAYLETAALLGFHVTPSLSIGGSIKHLQGLAFADFEGNGNLTTGFLDNGATADADGKLITTTSLSGQGMAFDLGLKLRATDRLTLGLGLLDIGSITWTDVTRTTYEAEFNMESEAYDFVETSEPVAELDQDLPMVSRAEFSYQFHPKVVGSGMWRRTYGEVPADEYGIGLRVSPFYILPLEVSLVNLYDNWSLNAGIGIHTKHFRWSIRAHNVMGLFDSDSAGFGLGTNVSIAF